MVCQQRRHPLHLTFQARRGVSTEGTAPPSRVLSEGGVVVVCQQRKHPLCLAFQAREGVEVVDGRETPPLSI